MRNSALKIALIFFVIGIAWIYITDYLIFEVSEDSILLGQNIKGSFYVIISSILLYYFVRREQQSLWASRSQYKRLFEENPVPMWIYDPSTSKVEAVNNSALKTYDYSHDAFLKLCVNDLVSNDNICMHEFDKETIKSLLDKGISIHKKRLGQCFFVKTKSHDTVFNNKNLKIVMAMDLHNLLIAENQIHKQNEKLKEIAQIQSHTIRRPVANILGLVSLFKKQNTADIVNTMVIDNLLKECEDLDSKINSIVQKSHEVEVLNSTIHA